MESLFFYHFLLSCSFILIFADQNRQYTNIGLPKFKKNVFWFCVIIMLVTLLEIRILFKNI